MIKINGYLFSGGRRKEKRDSLRLSVTGITDAAVPAMRKKYGSNAITRKKRRGFFSHFISNFNDPIIKILLGALVLNVIFSMRHDNLPETIGVAAAVLIATVVSTVSEYSSSLAAERLNDSEEEFCFVRRGEVKQIPTDEIVVGDIVLLRAGMRIPCDGAVISGGIVCDESALTGEGVEKKKIRTDPAALLAKFGETDASIDTDERGLVFRGATVLGGEGECVAVRTGDRTMYGSVAAGLETEAPESPLKRRLGVLAREISFIGYIAAAMVAISYLFNVFFIDNRMNIAAALASMQNIPYLMHELLCALTLAVSILVVAVPEGLPMMITVVLSSNMKRMLRHGVLVKRMVGIETAGSMNILFTDKTGTLTEGKMAVSSVVSGDDEFGTFAQMSRAKALARHLSVSSSALPSEGTHNSADTAISQFFGAKKGGGHEVVGRIPFESANRFAAVCITGDDGCVTFVRGAPEIILARSAKYLSSDGTVLPMNDAVLARIKRLWHDGAAHGKRVIASAELAGNALSDIHAKAMPELIFCGLYFLEDRLRSDAAKAVRTARKAGIHVIMMTGDNKVTAEAIARECGILDSGGLSFTGEDIAKMSDEEITAKLPRIAVIARALPTDKLRLVTLAQSAGFICGMTGDGINDAPSLRSADVGFAMGSGTDVAKEAGDIVITDDSFASIVRAVLYGRTIFRSIRKFIMFQLTMNLCATAISFIGPFVGIEAPVTIIQMLWVNIIMDTLGALAFAGEAPQERYMHRPPLPPDEKILSRGMILTILLSAGYTIALSLTFLLSPTIRAIFGRSEVYFLTAFFALFIFCGIGMSFNSRTPSANPLRALRKNKPFIIIMTAVAAVQLALVYFGGEVFRCTPLDARDLAATALAAFTVIPVGTIIKQFTMRGDSGL